MGNLDKARLLYLIQILNNETDENHALNTYELMDKIEEKFNEKTHRTTISSDIQLLNDFGYNIETTRSRQNQYYVGERVFSNVELKMLLDAINSSKFISNSQSKDLEKKLYSFTSTHEAEVLKRNLYTGSDLRADNDKIFYIINEINEAINLGRKIEFKYFKYTPEKKKELRHDGLEYVMSPYVLVWNGGYYYVVGWSDNHEKLVNFRVDRIYKSVKITEKAARKRPANFNIKKYVDQNFSMFSGETKQIRLKCENSTIDNIIDRFGEKTKITRCDAEHFFADISVAYNHIFKSWIFGFDGSVKIVSPEDIRQNYIEMLNKAIKGLKD